MMLAKTVVSGATTLVLASTMALAEDAAKGPAAEESGTLLRLEVVMTRSKGDTVIARLPYSMLVTTGGSYARVYGGIQLPILVRHEGSNTMMFKNAGTNVSARAWTLEDGRFKVELETELGGVYPTNGETAAAEAEGTPPAPVLRSFSTTATITLRDGQSTLLSDSADPITGETARTEVTLHVVK
jgi:Flp pilus assembly secretin CpaC